MKTSTSAGRPDGDPHLFLRNRPGFVSWLFGVLVTAAVLPATELPEAPLSATLRPGGYLELAWPAVFIGPGNTQTRPWFELQRSADLSRWKPFGERQRASSDSNDEPLRQTIAASQKAEFFRVLTIEPGPPPSPTLASGGEEVFGFASAFERALSEIGQIDARQFAIRYPGTAKYLPAITWDPTQSTAWTQFATNPIFQLSSAETEVLRRNGFVVSERLGGAQSDSSAPGPDPGSFAGSFYQIWYQDLPVFVSTDAILQAWHRTYDALLEETEETWLYGVVEELLNQMHQQLPRARAEASPNVLGESLDDAEYLLGVARSLLAGTPRKDLSPAVQGRVETTLTDIAEQRLKTVSDLFGSCRLVDFSQFTPRGHYTHSDRLTRYFRCVMWLGRIDTAIAGGPFERCPGAAQMATPRELGTAVILHRLLTLADQLPAWLALDRTIGYFVGWSDSLTFPQLGGILAGAGIHDLTDIRSIAVLEQLQAAILAGDLGVQNIRSDFFVSPLGGQPVQLPRSFLVLGQRFVPDSWMMSQVVFDSIRWVKAGATNKVMRRLPSALDVAFAVFGNDQVVPELVQRMTNANARSSSFHAVQWQEGWPYQHNLAAARTVLEAQSPSAWDSNIYVGWLSLLRELSSPTTDPLYPEAMRTRAWAMKTLNTQLASWTHLRHDTILYAKQSYTAGLICYYPHGYIEPRVSFWRRLQTLANQTADLLSREPRPGSYTQIHDTWASGVTFPPVRYRTNVFQGSTIQSNQVDHLRRFATTVAHLEALSRKELAGRPFDWQDELFIRNLIQHVDWLPQGSGRIRKYDGWYPQLFYRGVQFPDSTAFQEKYGANCVDTIIADVHTDLPAPIVNDPGSVLHQAIGRVNLLIIAVENGPDRMLFAGPVLSHYEVNVVGDPKRLDDTAWSQFLRWGTAPAGISTSAMQGSRSPPSWTSSYVVRR